MSEQAEVVVEAELDEAPDKVWRAVTEPDLIAAWLGDDKASLEEVRPAEDGRKVAWDWRGPADDRASVVEVELTPREGGGTHFRLTHSVAAKTTVMIFPRRMRQPAPRPRGCEMRLKWAA